MKDNENKMRIEIEQLKSKYYENHHNKGPTDSINQDASRIQDNLNNILNKTQPMIIKQSSVAVKDSLNFKQMKNI
jgi:hypothetical protein